ncbi:hypothetical protein [Paenibacillus sp. FSL L8-0463]
MSQSDPPLQYQKAIREQQTARRLLLSEGVEAVDAVFRGGCNLQAQERHC